MSVRLDLDFGSDSYTTNHTEQFKVFLCIKYNSLMHKLLCWLKTVVYGSLLLDLGFEMRPLCVYIDMADRKMGFWF